MSKELTKAIGNVTEQEVLSNLLNDIDWLNGTNDNSISDYLDILADF